MDTPDRGDSGTAPTLVANPSPDTLPTGQVRIDQAASEYEIREVLGRGGMGEVVLAHDTTMDRDVALKRMRSETPSEEATQRFLREAMIQARLDHPAVVPVHRLGVDDEGRPYFTMKRLAGTTLADVIEHRTATLQKQLRAIVDVCNAVELAHVRRIVHRDLKPSNIMLGDYGEVYVLDWGVARVLEGGPEARSASEKIPSLGGETQTGELLGTPGYMAPEQVRGADVGPAADVYALGAILFEILTGKPLHPRGTAALTSTLGDVDTSPASRAPDREVPPELDALCGEALASEPAARPSARALGDRIQNYLDGDRDLVRRRQYAAKLVAAGRAALLAGNRGEAVHVGGRALALDPTSEDAGELVMSLVLRPPDELPKELEADILRVEANARRERSRRAILPFLVPFLLIPFLPFMDVISWPMLVGVYAASALMAGIAFLNARTGKVPLGGYLIVNLGMVVLFSRVSGPLVLTPMLICGVAMSMTSATWLNERPLAVVLWVTALVTLPFALEWLGVFEPMSSVSPAGLLSKSAIFGNHSLGPVFAGNLALAVVVALYARGINSDRRLADKRLLIQRWHLFQLLPSTAATRARSWLTSTR